MPPRARLSIGASTVAKVFTFVIGLVLIAVAGLVGLVAYGFAYGAREIVSSSINDGVWHRDPEGKLVPGPSSKEIDTVGVVGGIAGGLCALLFLFLAFYLILRVLRSGAWLTGSVLHRRGALRTRSVDLATASVSGGSALTAVGASNKIVLPLPLPEDQLMLLANAITNARVRSGPDDVAFIVAEKLRSTARDPFS